MNDSEPVNALKLQHKIPAHSKTQVPVQVPSGQSPDVEPPNGGQQAPIGGHGGDVFCGLLGLIGGILGVISLQSKGPEAQIDTEPVVPTEP